MSTKRLLLASAAFLAGTILLYNGLSQNKVAAEPTEGKQRPKIDLAFCIDTTGSMQGEIDAVKSKTKEIVAKLSGSKPAPEIRVGLVAYRDRGDSYVTKVFQFSDNIDQIVKDISSLNADGGGDEPEAVNEALHASVNDLSWSGDKKTVKLLFLIGDAGPSQYEGDYNWESESKDAISRGIQINTIACGNMAQNSDTHQVFEKIAKLADGKSEFLTYRQEIVDESGARSTLVSSAGRVYKVAPSAAAKWRDGADKLVASGGAAPMAADMPMAAPSSAAMAGVSSSLASAEADAGAFTVLDSRPVVRDFRSAGRHAMMPTARTSAYMGAPSGFAGPSAGASAAASYGDVGRSESNLDDIVLGAAKEAAKKKANIEYKD